MDNFIKMLNIQGVLLVYLLVGIYVRKRNFITDKTRKYFTDFIIQITLPCMIFNSFMQDISRAQFLLAGQILLVAFCVCIFSFFLGKVLYNRYSDEKKSIMQYGTLISNSGFAGMPMVADAYGEAGLFYAAIFVIPVRIFMWSAGISIFTQADFKTKVKSVMLNPGIIAVELGLLRMLFRIPVHPVLGSGIKNIGACTMALSMIVIGTILAENNVRAIFDSAAIYLTVVRLLLIPVILIIVLKLLGADQLLTAVAVTLTAMPVGSTTPILAEKYGADYLFASKGVFLSTVLSLITVPILTIFL